MLQPNIQIWANDTDEDNLDVYWYENSTGSWELRNINRSISANSTASYTFSQFNQYNTTYYFKLAINDSKDNISQWFYFKTNNIPEGSLIYPSPNGTTAVNLNPTCRFWANDTDGDSLTVKWYENSTGNYVLRNTNLSIIANNTVSYTFPQFNEYNSTYYFKVAIEDGKDEKNIWSYFTTKSVKPIVSTNISTGVEETNATLQGFLDSDGGESTECGFLIGNSSGLYSNNISVGNIQDKNDFQINTNDSKLYERQTTRNNDLGLSPSHNPYIAQTFTIGNTGENETFPIKKIQIKTLNTTQNTITTEATGEWITINLNNHTQLNKGNTYAITLHSPNSNGSDYLKIKTNTNNPYTQRRHMDNRE